MAGEQGHTYSGVSNIVNQISTLRPNAVDTLKIMEKQFGDVGFLHALFHKSITKRAVNDFKFIRGERQEDPVTLTISAWVNYIDSGNSIQFRVPVQEANRLQEGMTLMNTNVDYDGITAGTYQIPAAISSVRKPEIVEITSIAMFDADYSTVTAKRAHSIYGGAGTNKGTVAWATTHTVLRGNFIAHDSESYHTPFDVNPELFYNYIGDFRMPVGSSERKRNVKQWAEDDGTMNALIARKLDTLLKDMERAMLFQSYGLDTAQTGRERTGSRSMIEILPSANWLSVDAATIHALDEQLSFFTQKGRATDKRILVGPASFINRFSTLFTDHLTEEPLYGDKNIGWKIPTYSDKLGGKYQLMYSYQMGQAGDIFDNRAFVINMNAVNYAYFVGNEGSFDLYLDKGPDGKGLQGNGSKDLIYEWRACVGLDVMAWDYHGMLTLNF